MLMNQIPAPQSKPDDVLSDQKVANLKKIIIAIVLAAVLILGAIVVFVLVGRAQNQKRAEQDRNITNAMFQLRLEAQNYYEQNKSYQNWSPNTDLVNLIGQNESAFQIKKPDYQNFLIAAYLPGEKTYFCIDTKGFVGQIKEIKNTQIKCEG